MDIESTRNWLISFCVCCVLFAGLSSCGENEQDHDADSVTAGNADTPPFDNGSSMTTPSLTGGDPNPVETENSGGESGTSDAPLVTVFDSGLADGSVSENSDDAPVENNPPIDRPLTLESGQYGDWTYYEVEDAVCRDGSPAGYYLKKGMSPNLLIYLNGGGFCYDDLFCAINPPNVNYSMPSENLSGATADVLINMQIPLRQIPPDEGIFRTDNRNPVGDWNMVFVPYCTGDMHAGTQRDATVSTSALLPPQQFVGYLNLGLFYRSFGGDYMDAENVLLAGSSAGGFGALINFDRTQEFFKNSTVYIISDSGVPFRDKYIEPCLQKRWREQWGLDGALPPDCKGCFNDDGGGLVEGLGEYVFREKYAGRMLGGVLSSEQDQIIKLFFAVGLNDCTINSLTEAALSFYGGSSYPIERYPLGLLDFVENVAGRDNAGSYFIPGNLHQHLFRPRYYQDNGVGRTIAGWVADILDGRAEHVGVL